MYNPEMRGLPLIVLLFFITITHSSCQSTVSTVMDVEVGNTPQEVEDVYVESPENISVEVWQQDLDIPWSLVFSIQKLRYLWPVT